MSRDLAREIGRERIAGARRRRLVRDVKLARRAERSRPDPVVVERPALTAAPAPRPEDVVEELGILLGGVAERIADHGTASEPGALRSVYDAARWVAPGAAAALVDRDGSEPARLRAFGILHGVVLSLLGPEDRAWLLDRLRGGSAHDQDDRVA